METDIEYNSGIKLSEINKQNRKVLDIMLEGVTVSRRYMQNIHNVECPTARFSNLNKMFGSDFIERQYHKDGKPKKPTQWKVSPEKILEVKKILNLK